MAHASLKVASFASLVVGLVVAVIAVVLMFMGPIANDLGPAGSVMFTLHPTQYSHNKDPSQSATRYWAMFVPALTENPSDVASHGRSLVLSDMCVNCEDDGIESCNYIAQNFSDAACFDEGQQHSPKQHRKMRCNAQTVQSLMLETNEFTSMGITGVTQANTLQSTLLLGAGVALILFGVDILTACQDDNTDTEGCWPLKMCGMTDTVMLENLVPFAIAFCVILLYVIRVMTFEPMTSDFDLYTQQDVTQKTAYKVKWSHGDNASLYSLLFLTLFIGWIVNKKTTISHWLRHKAEVGHRLELQGAVDIAIVFVFQFLVWFEIVNSNRSMLDIKIQMYLLASAGIGVTVLLNNEVVSAMTNFGNFRPTDKRDVYTFAFVLSLASLGIITFLWVGCLNSDLIAMRDMWVTLVFWAVLFAPLAFMVLYFAYKSMQLKDTLGDESMFFLMSDGWKLSLLSVVVVFMVILKTWNTSTWNMQYQDVYGDLQKECSTNCEGFKMRARFWMHTALSVQSAAASTSPDYNSRVELCKHGVFPDYKCVST